MPFKVQKTKTEEKSIKVDKELDRSVDLSQWEVVEHPQQANVPAQNAPIPVNIQDSGDVQIEGAQQQEAQAIAPQYIGFSEAYTQAEKKDSERMKAIRKEMQEYFRLKKALDRGVQDRLLTLDKAIRCLERLNENCDNYCFFRHSLFTYGSKRKEEVIAVRKEAKKELAERRNEYVVLADKWTEDNANVDPKLKKRFRYEGKVREVKLAEKNGDLRKLNFDDYTKLDSADYDAHVEKLYFANKAKYDLIRTDISFTSGEKALLNEILGYGENEFAHRKRALSGQKINQDYEEGVGWKNWPNLSSFIGLFVHSGRHFQNLWRFFYTDRKTVNNEIESYQKIMSSLKKILANPKLSEEKKQVFLKYQKRLSSFDGGKLETENIPEEKIRDYTNIQRYTLSRQIEEKDRKEGGPTTKEDWFLSRDNRKDEPLFAHTPCMSDIVQYIHGNCFALAAIASVVSKNPDAILNMFKDEGERGVVVRLWHSEPDMSAPDPAPGQERPKKMQPVYYRVDKIVSYGTNIGALWVNVLMNAIVAYRQDFPDAWDRYNLKEEVKKRIARQKENGIKELDFGVVACGGWSEEVLPVLTGNEHEEMTSYKGSVYESGNANNILSQVYSETATLEQRKEWAESGEVLNKDFATYKIKISGNKEVNVTHYKDIFDKLTSGVKQKHEEVLEKVRENDEKERQAREPVDNLWNGCLSEAKAKYLKYYDKEMSEKQIADLKAIFELPNHKVSRGDEAQYGGSNFVDFVENSVMSSFFYGNRDADTLINDAKRKTEKIQKENIQLLEDFYDEHGMLQLEIRQNQARRSQYEYSKGIHDEKEAREVFDKELKEIDGYLSSAYLIIFNRPVMDHKDSNKEAFEEHLKNVKKLTVNDFPEPKSDLAKENDVFNILAKRTGKTRSECFDIAFELCVRNLEKVIESYDGLVSSKKLEYFSGVYSDEALEMYDKIKDSLDKGLDVAAGTRVGMGDLTGRGESKDIGTVGGHAYSVLGVAEVMFNGTPVKMVKVRNPWGAYSAGYYYNEKTKKVEVKTDVNSDSGVFMIELTHFWRTFDNIYTTKPKPVA